MSHSLLRTVCLQHGPGTCPHSWYLYSFLYPWHTLEVNLKIPLAQLWSTLKGVNCLSELLHKRKTLTVVAFWKYTLLSELRH